MYYRYPKWGSVIQQFHCFSFQMIFTLHYYCRVSSKRSMYFDLSPKNFSTNVYPQNSPTEILYMPNTIPLYHCKSPPSLKPAQSPAEHTLSASIWSSLIQYDQHILNPIMKKELPITSYSYHTNFRSADSH